MFPQEADKHDRPAVITPERFLAYRRAHGGVYEGSAPRNAILVYQSSAYTHVTETYDGEEIDELLGHAYRLDGEGSTVVVGNFGIGGPVTASVAEMLIAWGTERLIIAGAAGSLQPSFDIGDVVVADRAIRDEGTSHHYLPSDRTVDASGAVVDALTTAAGDQLETTGPTWTTDAIFRETVEEVSRRRRDGVLTVEMEAATLFSIAEYRDVDAGAVFAISDILSEEGWDPHFHDLDESLEDVVDTAVTACRTRSTPRNR